MRMDRNPILLEVFRRIGSASQLARELGVTRAAISRWNQVPLKHLARIAEMTQMTRQQLRPDLYEEPIRAV